MLKITTTSDTKYSIVHSVILPRRRCDSEDEREEEKAVRGRGETNCMGEGPA
jgi:hypothetical protein